MDNSRSPLFRDSVFLPPSFHPLLTSPPLHKCFRHPLSLTSSSKTLCEREIKKIQETQRKQMDTSPANMAPKLAERLCALFVWLIC